ncbi:hypothetical protein OJAV_G00022380 [Oryzias javanicus]|uniref:Telomere repeats-binding bouquet formation protein 2 n=1 Tax=Oryzias javanicus TaxID=123683 RepID=A0A3S2PIE6_ORYJA|nr:hypothetical protein OJAV_G00022380 [Oryzias javanicus]
MFRCRSAWFSKSVNEANLKFWVQEGGTITGWRQADFIFSEDAMSSDTLRIYESKDFLWDKVTVFHSLFLSTCEKRRSVRSVSIGHYVLPPVSVQHEVRKVIGRLIWECESDLSVDQENPVNPRCLDDESGDEVSISNCESSDEDSSPEREDHLRNKANGTLTGYISMDSLQKYSGELSDYYPKHFPCLNCGVCVCLTTSESNEM